MDQVTCVVVEGGLKHNSQESLLTPHLIDFLLTETEGELIDYFPLQQLSATYMIVSCVKLVFL